MKPSNAPNDREKILASIREIELEKARIDFWSFCCLFAPEFYNKSHLFLRIITHSMQEFIDSDDSVLIINAPPRHGKSRTACLFVPWLLGRNPKLQIMTGSYNELLSETFSKQVRDMIDTERADPKVIVYRDVFPGNRIKKGDGAVTRWSLVGQHASYLATSPTGTATGFGADILIIDDIIKSALEANNELILEKHWDWFTNTMMSRLEGKSKIIIIMTRWHSKDLSGRIEDHFTGIGKGVKKLTFKALQDDGTMLCDDILSAELYKTKLLTTSPEIAAANYQQEPIDIQGRLYSGFKTYEAIPTDDQGRPALTMIRAYVDTADEGDDYLCCLVYGAYNHEAYVLDVLYTQKPMEWTEPAVAAMLTKHHVSLAVIESNNGGRGFARSVERLCIQKKNYFTVIKWFHQSLNKHARILTNATWAMEHVYFPHDWGVRWPEFFESLTNYQQAGKNKHDDAEDALTGMCERMQKRGSDIGPLTVRM